MFKFLSLFVKATPTSIILTASSLSSGYQPQGLYDTALQFEASSDWAQAVKKWKECVNETLRQTEKCRVQCQVAYQHLPEDRGVESGDGVFQKAAGKSKSPCRIQRGKETVSKVTQG